MKLARIAALSLPLLTALAVSAHPAAAAGWTTETTMSSAGTPMMRTLTQTDGIAPPSDADQTVTPAQPQAARDANTYLWVDRNHLNGIAERVAITGDGLHAVAGWWLNSPRVTLYNIPGDDIPEWTRPMAVQFYVEVDADGPGDRITATGRGDSLYVFDYSTPDPVSSHWYTPPFVGYKCGVSLSGNTYMSAGGNPDGTLGEVEVYDGSGLLRFKELLPAPPEGVCVSADGLVAAANVRGFVKIWNAMTGALRDSVPIAGETQVPAVLSGDGSGLVTGGFARTVRYYLWNGTDYVQQWSYNMAGVTWVTAVAISEDGSTIAAGGWNSGGLFSGRVALFDRSSSTPLWFDANYGDWISSVSLSANGGMLAAGSWGRAAGTVGNVVSIYTRGSATPLNYIQDDAVAGVGSCSAVDVSRDGAYLIAGGKAVHAREFGNGGWTMAIRLPDPAEIAEGGVTLGTPRLLASPNPFTGSVQINLAGSAALSAGPARIFAADGSLVRALPSVGSASGWTWDGKDAAGRPVPAGAYFIRSQDASVRLVRAR